MTVQWYFARNNQKHGPFSSTQLKQFATSGQLQPTDMVHRSDMQKWMPAAQVKGLFTIPPPTKDEITLPTEATPAAFAVLAEPTSSYTIGRKKAKTNRGKSMIWAGVGGVLLVGLALLAGYLTRSGSGAKPRTDGNSLVSRGQTSDKVKTRAEASGSKVDDLPPLQLRPLPDFSKVDYSVDFSKINYSPVDFTKLDYTKGPQGQAIQERKGAHPKEKNSPYWGKPYLERGYTGQSGEFVRHGVMTTWQLGARSKTTSVKFEEVQFYNGKRHGTFVAWDKKGYKEDEGFAVEGKLSGCRRGFYPSGQKKTESYYVGGNQHGISQAWHENGKLMAQGTFDNGQRHGRFLRWHPDGAKDDEEFYIDGKLHGPLTAWYPNGQKKVESVFVNGKQETRRLEWYENGQKALEIVYIDGLAQGENKQWHANGKVSNEGLWKDGKEEEVWTRWHPNGRKQSQVEFIAGKRQGRLESWYENGQLDEVATFDQGKKNGKNTRYCPNGKLLFEHQFINGIPHGLWVEYEGTGSGRVSKTFNYP